MATCLPRQHAQWRNVERSHQHGQSHPRSLSFNHLPGGLQHRHTSDGQRFNKHLVGQLCRRRLFIPTSGVTSLGAKPVPPVVRIRLSSSSSHHSNRVSWKTHKRASAAQFRSGETVFLQLALNRGDNNRLRTRTLISSISSGTIL